jgi:hypothetical protein
VIDGAWPELIAYALDRESQSVQSVTRIAAVNVAPILSQLRAFADQQKARIPRPSAKPAPRQPENDEAARIVVRRKRFGNITLDDLPVTERQGYPPALWSGVPVTALYWCDGRRNLAEVMRLTQLELGPTNFDFVGYFRFLEKHGYVEFVK